MEKRQISIWTACGITATWLVIALFVMSKHEIWLDEAQHWLLARDSHSLGELFTNMRYEGHPPMWNVLLFFVSRITSSPLGMQILHLCFAGGTVFLIVRYAPFPVWAKAILPFTYFFGYEYAIIARNYAPAVFFILLACVLIHNRKGSVFLVATLLGIAVLFHSYSVVIAVPVLVFYARSKRTEGVSRLLAPAAIFLFMLGVAAWFSAIPRDHFLLELHVGDVSWRKMGSILLVPFTSLMHFPMTGQYWWNSNVFLQGGDWVKLIVGVIFWPIPLVLLRNNRKGMLIYAGGILLLSSALLITPMVISVRHAGFAVLLFVVSWWLSGSELKLSKWNAGVLIVLLTVQVAAFATTIYKEVTAPFSESRNVSQFIEAKYPDLMVAVYPHYAGPAIPAYLGKKVFYAERKALGSFASWEGNRFIIDTDEMLDQCNEFMNREQLDTMVLVTNRDNPYGFEIPGFTELVGVYDQSAVQSENYNVYLLKRK